jgi:hypothetical protein
MADLAAENPEATDEIEAQMISKQGAWYAEGFRRVQFEMMIRQPGISPVYALREEGIGEALGAMLFGWIPAGILPEGELHQRGLYDEFSKARDAYNAGDKEAYQTFFDKYPEYSARLALFKEPEERLHAFLENQLYETWSRLPPATKDVAKRELGDDFATMFAEYETRDLDGVSNKTLAWWVHALAGKVPEGYTPEDKAGVEMPPEQVSLSYQRYLATREAKWGNVNQMNAVYGNASDEMKEWLIDNTPIADYWVWNRKYQHDHPELIPYMIEKSRLYGADPQTAQLYFAYEVEFNERFPDYYDHLEQWIDNDKRNPSADLQAAWKFKNDAIQNFPQLTVFIEDDPTGVASAMKYQDVTPQQIIKPTLSIKNMSPPMRESLYNHFVLGDDLGVGVLTELLRLYELDDTHLPFDEWVEDFAVLYESQK